MVGTASVASCVRCLFPVEDCLCEAFAPVETRTEVIVLRHVAERRRRSNSGRAVANLLPNARVVDHGGIDALDASSDVPQRDAMLLWPEGPPVEPPWRGPPPRHLIVLDGTWPQARRMRRRIAALDRIPTLHVAPLAARQRMRQTPSAGRVSTLEAVAAAIELFEGPGTAGPLLALFDRMTAVLYERGRSRLRRW